MDSINAAITRISPLINRSLAENRHRLNLITSVSASILPEGSFVQHGFD